MSSSPLPRPLSIVHLTGSLRGGPGRTIVELAAAQRRLGNSVALVTSEPGGAGSDISLHVDRLRYEGIRVVTGVPAMLTLGGERAHAILSADRAEPIDILHAHCAASAHLAAVQAALGPGTPVPVRTHHGWSLPEDRLELRLDDEGVSGMHAIVTTTRATARVLHRLGVASEITVIPAGLPAPPPMTVSDEARRCLGVLRGAGRRIIGGIGTERVTDTHAVVVEALAQTGDPGLTAVFLGAGSEGLADVAAAHGVRDRVHPLGVRPHAERWLPLIDLLVVPAAGTRVNITMLEAMRAGVPVAAADTPAMREIIADGENGWLFAPGDAVQLAATMIRALHAMTGDRARAVQAARQLFLEQYNIVEIAADHQRLYYQLLESERRMESGSSHTL